MFLCEAKSQGRQFLVTLYPENFGDSPAVAPKKAASIDVLAGDRNDDEDWDLSDLMGGPP